MRKIKQWKKTFWLLFISLFLLLVLDVVGLNQYLYTVQRIDRFENREDDDFFLSFSLETRPQTTYRTTVSSHAIYYEGIDQIYIHYGSVSLFLEDALNNEYITIDSLLSHTIKRSNKEEEDTDLYYYQNTRENISFEILIDEVSIVFRPVQSS